MNELEKLRAENIKLKQDIQYHIRKEREMVDTILILKTKVIELMNHHTIGIDEQQYEAYCKILKAESKK